MRKAILNASTKFSGTFPVNCQSEAVPLSLQTLVAMICYGANIIECIVGGFRYWKELSTDSCTRDLAILQLAAQRV